MGLGCTGTIAKLLLFIINFAIFACGAVLLGVGIALIVDDDAISWITDITGGSGMDDALFQAAVYTMLAIGGTLFIVGFFGCCGACKENTCMLSTYAFLVTLLLIGQIVGGILAAVYSSSIDEEVLKSMETSAIEKYGIENDTLLDKAWDDMQYQWKCCGANDHTDYLNNSFILEKNWTVAISCCTTARKNDDGDIDISPEDNEACQAGSANGDLFHNTGCYQSFKDWVEDNTNIIMGVFFGLAALELLGVLIACCVKGRIEKSHVVM